MSSPSASPGTLETRRIGLFLLVAFGVSWTVGGVVAATGGLTDSPVLAPGVTLATVLLAVGYMFGPAIGTVVTRIATGEGWADARLRPRLRGNLRTYLAAWFAPPALTLLGVGVFFLVFPGRFDPQLRALREALAAAGVPTPPGTVVLVQVVAALTVGTALNTVFAFGEEFGWRAYLLQKLSPLGRRRATLLVGAIWGVWHWPVIAMGYNYGFDYPGAPWVGMAAMVWFTVVVGVLLAWVAYRADSVWPAAVGHGAVNAIGAVGLLFVTGQTSSLIGPAITGVVTLVPWVVAGVYLLWRAPVFEG